MKAIAFPRRAMRPHAEKDNLPAACAWCGKPVSSGVVLTYGHDMGKPAIVCPTCLAPPKPGERLAELTDGETL